MVRKVSPSKSFAAVVVPGTLVASGCPGGVVVVRREDLGDAVGGDPHLPASAGWSVAGGFDEVVVVRADQDQIVQGRAAARPPRNQVMGVTDAGGGVAAGEAAAAVPEHERGSDRRSYKALRPAHIEHLGGSAEHDGQDLGVAGELA